MSTDGHPTLKRLREQFAWHNVRYVIETGPDGQDSGYFIRPMDGEGDVQAHEIKVAAQVMQDDDCIPPLLIMHWCRRLQLRQDEFLPPT